jgi:hypothetical protein
MLDKELNMYNKFNIRRASKTLLVCFGFLLCFIQIIGGAYILVSAADDHFVRLGQAYLFSGLSWGALWSISLFVFPMPHPHRQVGPRVPHPTEAGVGERTKQEARPDPDKQDGHGQ